jgi:hypothetical protein
MVGKLVRNEVAQQPLSDLVWKLHNGVKPSSLTSVFQQIESRKAHNTLRSAERAPIPLATLGDRLLSAERNRKKLHCKHPQGVCGPTRVFKFESHPVRLLQSLRGPRPPPLESVHRLAFRYKFVVSNPGIYLQEILAYKRIYSEFVPIAMDGLSGRCRK